MEFIASFEESLMHLAGAFVAAVVFGLVRRKFSSSKKRRSR
jgi:hypothetical protein